jgi:hypothetical protein
VGPRQVPGSSAVPSGTPSSTPPASPAGPQRQDPATNPDQSGEGGAPQPAPVQTPPPEPTPRQPAQPAKQEDLDQYEDQDEDQDEEGTPVPDLNQYATLGHVAHMLESGLGRFGHSFSETFGKIEGLLGEMDRKFTGRLSHLEGVVTGVKDGHAKELTKLHSRINAAQQEIQQIRATGLGALITPEDFGQMVTVAVDAALKSRPDPVDEVKEMLTEFQEKANTVNEEFRQEMRPLLDEFLAHQATLAKKKAAPPAQEFDAAKFKEDVLAAVRKDNLEFINEIQGALAALKAAAPGGVVTEDPAKQPEVAPDNINNQPDRTFRRRVKEGTTRLRDRCAPGAVVVRDWLLDTLLAPLDVLTGLAAMKSTSSTIDIEIERNEQVSLGDIAAAKEGTVQLLRGLRNGVPLAMGISTGLATYAAGGSVTAYGIAGTETTLAVLGGKSLVTALVAGLGAFIVGTVAITAAVAYFASAAIAKKEAATQAAIAHDKRHNEVMAKLSAIADSLVQKPVSSLARAA